jgi:two-component system, OmpR family, KDP operon response regulator KdpE
VSGRPDILLASPDRGIQRLLRRTFEAAGYAVVTAYSGAATLAAIRLNEPDLIILSAEFTDIGGAELIAQARQASAASIIALFYPNGSWSARKLLDIGADDCVEEPFLVQELAARVRRLLLRAGVWLHPHSVPTALGTIEIDPLARTARLAGEPLGLTGREFDLLLVLLSAGGSPVAHDEVLQRIWGKGIPNARQNLRRVVSSLRARIEGRPDQPALLVNVRGLGYRLVVSDATVPTSSGEPAT